MSITPVPISIRLVLTPIAARSGKGDESCRAKWWTRTKAPSIPISSAATASSTVWLNASPPVWVSPPPGCQAPNERKPIRFGLVIVSALSTWSRVARRLPLASTRDALGQLFCVVGRRDRGAVGLQGDAVLEWAGVDGIEAELVEKVHDGADSEPVVAGCAD